MHPFAQRLGQSPPAGNPAPSSTSTTTTLSTTTLSTTTTLPLSAQIQAYCQRLLQQKQGRPARQETLLNSIRTYLKITPEEATVVFSALLTRQAITLNGQKITYHDAKLKT